MNFKIKKSAIYAVPFTVLFSGCAMTKAIYNSNRIYHKIPNTKYTLSTKKPENVKLIDETFRTHINVLSILAEDQGKTLEEICKEADKNNNKDIDDNEYFRIIVGE